MAKSLSKKTNFFFKHQSREQGASSGLLWMFLALFLVLGLGALLLRPQVVPPKAASQAPLRPGPQGQNKNSPTLRLNASPMPGQPLNLQVLSKVSPNDWLTLVPAEAPEQDWEGQFFLQTDDLTTLQTPTVPGHYEVRLYRNWPSGGTRIEERLAFEIPGLAPATAAKPWVVDITQDLTYTGNELPPDLSWGQTSLATDSQPAEKGLKEPPSVPGPKLYGHFRLGNSEDPIYSFLIQDHKFYLDRNNNEDLSDDGDPGGEGSGSVAVEVDLIAGDGQRRKSPYQIWYFFNGYMNGYRFYTRCFYTGELSLNGLTVKALAFESQNHNGRWRDDGIWLDLNQNGHFDKEEHFAHHDRVPIGAGIFDLQLKHP